MGTNGTEIPVKKKNFYPKIFVYFAKLFSFHLNSRKCYAIRLWKFLGIENRIFHRMESTRSVVEKSYNSPEKTERLFKRSDTDPVVNNCN